MVDLSSLQTQQNRSNRAYGGLLMTEINPKFAPVGEKEVTKAIVEGFSKEFTEHIESDVIIVGAGPSGLVAAKDIAKKKYKVLLVERMNYLGGGFWIGGYLMNKVTVRDPGQSVLDIRSYS